MSAGLTRRDSLALGALSAAGLALAGPARGGTPPRPGQPFPDQDLPTREASWYQKLAESRIECRLCPRHCRVAPAERGSCGARENRDGVYHTLVHSLACAVHVDPIEKKPFFHVVPGATALSFAAAGCNVECRFCQNWEISQFRPEQVRSLWMPPEALAAAARRAGAPLMAATYSEPVVFWEYVRDTAAAGRKQGLRTVVVSNGFIEDQPLREVLPLLAAVKVDLKAFTDHFYRDVVRGELKPVLETLKRVRAAGTWLEVVVLLIPTLNDSEAEVRALASWVRHNLGADVPLHFSRFYPTYRLTNLPPTPLATLERSVAAARAEGLRYVYLGNVPGHPDESTRCPGCGDVVIRRVGFTLLANELRDGRCPRCRTAIPGVWS